MISYRNHKLTQLMQDSLGGSAKTLMFVNCSPASSNLDETTRSLKYATRACSSFPRSELPTLVLQASFDGTSVQFLTMAGEEFDRIRLGPAVPPSWNSPGAWLLGIVLWRAALRYCIAADPLADVRTRLLAGRLSRVLGSTFATADAVLPGGELMSRAHARKTCAGAFVRAGDG